MYKQQRSKNHLEMAKKGTKTPLRIKRMWMNSLSVIHDVTQSHAGGKMQRESAINVNTCRCCYKT